MHLKWAELNLQTNGSTTSCNTLLPWPQPLRYLSQLVTGMVTLLLLPVCSAMSLVIIALVPITQKIWESESEIRHSQWSPRQQQLFQDERHTQSHDHSTQIDYILYRIGMFQQYSQQREIHPWWKMHQPAPHDDVNSPLTSSMWGNTRLHPASKPESTGIQRQLASSSQPSR